MIAKTPNIRCFVAKMHLSRFTGFFRQQIFPFYPFRREGCQKGTMSPFFTFFLYRGFPNLCLQKISNHPTPLHKNLSVCTYLVLVVERRLFLDHFFLELKQQVFFIFAEISQLFFLKGGGVGINDVISDELLKKNLHSLQHSKITFPS